jgi:hypothetical protein
MIYQFNEEFRESFARELSELSERVWDVLNGEGDTSRLSNLISESRKIFLNIPPKGPDEREMSVITTEAGRELIISSLLVKLVIEKNDLQTPLDDVDFSDFMQQLGKEIYELQREAVQFGFDKAMRTTIEKESEE